MRRPLALLALPLLTLSACGNTVSTASFKGAQHEVAQTIANLQSDATTAEQKKICANDLAAAVVRRLGGSKRCEAAIKSQLTEISNLEVRVESVKVASDATTATAAVRSVHEGKSKAGTLSLLKEGGKWKISGL